MKRATGKPLVRVVGDEVNTDAAYVIEVRDESLTIRPFGGRPGSERSVTWAWLYERAVLASARAARPAPRRVTRGLLQTERRAEP